MTDICHCVCWSVGNYLRQGGMVSNGYDGLSNIDRKYKIAYMHRLKLFILHALWKKVMITAIPTCLKNEKFTPMPFNVRKHCNLFIARK